MLRQIYPILPFIIKTDSSGYAIGAVLIQGQSANEHPIEFASRMLTPAEINYSTIERKALAVVWAVTKFGGYIEGSVLTLTTQTINHSNG